MSLVRHEPRGAGPSGADAILHSLAFPAALLADSGQGFVLDEVNERLLITLSLPKAAVQGRVLSQALAGTTGDQFAVVANQCLSAGAPIRARGYDDLASFDIIATLASTERRVRVLLMLEPLFQRHMLEPGQQALFEQLGPLSRGLIYVYDPLRKQHRYVQGELAVAAGLPPGQISDDDLFSRAHPEDVSDLVRHFTALSDLQDGDVAAVTLRVRRPDSDVWVWMHARSRVLSRKPDGTIRRIIGLACDVTEERRIADQLAKVSAALSMAEENERRLIGRELHDSTAQLLVAAGLGLSALQRRTSLKPDAQQIVADLRSTIAAAQREIRNFSYMLHPPSLRRAGLAQAISEFASGFGRRTGLRITVDLPELGTMPEPVEMALFRVAQEALMNTSRHAKAHQALIRLRRDGATVVLEVEDDGIGMVGRAPTPGVGIAAMTARMQQLGGELDLGPGGLGFRVTAKLTLRAA